MLAALGVGALVGSVAATRLRPSRPLVFVALMDALFGLPLAFLAAMASGADPCRRCGPVGHRDDARHVNLGDDASARDSGGVALAGGFLRLVRVVRVYPIGLAVWGPLAGVIGIHTALWLAFGIFLASVLALVAVPDIRRRPAFTA